jgi:hypothetical protein
MVNNLNGDDNENLVVKLSNFDTGHIVRDMSPNDNEGYILGYDDVDEVSMDIGFGTEYQSAILLNSVSEVMINSSPTLKLIGDSSIQSWIFSYNWIYGHSTSIIGNYYKGGYKLENINHGLYYSYLIPNASVEEERFTILPCNILDDDDIVVIDDIGGIPVAMLLI